VLFYAYVLDVDADVVQRRIVDRYLNEPGGWDQRFVAATGQVLLAFTRLQHVNSTVPEYAARGWFPEQEFAIWLLVEDRQEKTMYFYHPYMIVDNVFAMAIGREVYGFPKSIGQFVIPESAKDVDYCSVSTFGIKHYGPDSEGGLFPWIEVTRTSSRATDPMEKVWTSMVDLLKDVYIATGHRTSFGSEIRTDFNTAVAWMRGEIGMVFLKQFRDVAQLDRACYQSVNLVTAQVVGFHGAGVLAGDYEINIQDLDSHPIRADLGLPSEGSIRPTMSFWVEFDFNVAAGKSLSHPTSPESAGVAGDPASVNQTRAVIHASVAPSANPNSDADPNPVVL
jgi:hypothetical protein